MMQQPKVHVVTVCWTAKTFSMFVRTRCLSRAGQISQHNLHSRTGGAPACTTRSYWAALRCMEHMPTTVCHLMQMPRASTQMPASQVVLLEQDDSFPRPTWQQIKERRDEMHEKGRMRNIASPVLQSAGPGRPRAETLAAMKERVANARGRVGQDLADYYQQQMQRCENVVLGARAPLECMQRLT